MMKKLILMIAFMLILSYTAVAEVSLTNVALSAATTNPNSQATLTITVENTNNIAIETVDLKATLSGTTSEASGTVSNVVMASPQTTTLTLNVPANTAPGAHVITVTATNRANAADTDSIAKDITINRVVEIDLLKDNTNVESGMTFTLEDGDVSTATLKIKNTGNVALNNVAVKPEFSSLKDSDDNQIKITVNPTSIAAIPAGQEATITLTIDVESGFEVGDVKGNLAITANEGTIPSVPLTLRVSPVVCAVSSTGKDLEIDITEPDDDDEFEPGDEFTLVVNVDNRANDNKRIEVEAVLYNLDEDKREEKQTKTIKIDEKEDEDFTFDFVIPEDADDSDEFELFVRAFERGEEDVNCNQESISLDIDVPDHKLLIDSFTLTPAVAECGSTVTGSLVLRNLGSSDEDVTVEELNEQLKIAQASSPIEVQEDRDENVEQANFRFVVPQNAKDVNYAIQAKANYGGLVTAEKTLTLVNCDGTTPQPQPSTGATQTPATGTQPVTGSTTFEDKDFFDRFNFEEGIPTSVWVMINVLLGVLVILVLVWIFRKH